MSHARVARDAVPSGHGRKTTRQHGLFHHTECIHDGLWVDLACHNEAQVV